MNKAVDRPLRWALLRHVAGLAGVLTVVVVLAVTVSNRLATTEARKHAEADVRTLASSYVEPFGGDDLQSVGSSAQRVLGDELADRIAEGSLRGVKIWEPAGPGAGRIIYSDIEGIEGQVLSLGEAFRLFGSRDAMASTVSPGGYAEAYPDGTFEVSVGFLDRRGSPYIFEAYLPTPDLAIPSSELLRVWLPLVVGSLVLLAVATLPLSLVLARRASRAEREHSAMALRALDASEQERRRLAQRLHDGVLQDLAGAGLALDSLAGDTHGPGAASTVARTASLLRADVAQLRALAEELSPDALQRDGLEDAIRETVRSLAGTLAPVQVSVDGAATRTDEEAMFAYRVVREGLRNMARHSRASCGEVAVAATGDGFVVSVCDDGIGFHPRVERPGHLGLRLLNVAARDIGGQLEVESAPGEGTRLVLTVARGRSAS